MREIKFRAKSKTSGNWVYSMTLANGHTKMKSYEYFMEIAPERWVGVEKETIGQFTGLYDKHGKEIYEGDVVKDDHGRIMKIGEWRYKPCFIAVSKTNFHHADFFEWLNRDTNVLECEVIGNIHENPELLEQ